MFPEVSTLFQKLVIIIFSIFCLIFDWINSDTEAQQTGKLLVAIYDIKWYFPNNIIQTRPEVNLKI